MTNTVKPTIGVYYRTANGKRAMVVISSSIPEANINYPLLGWVQGGIRECWSEEGISFNSNHDLVALWKDKPKKKAVTNLYLLKDGTTFITDHYFSPNDIPEIIASKEVEITEGEFIKL